MILYNKGRKNILGVNYKEGQYAAFRPGTSMDIQDKEAKRLLELYPKFLTNPNKTTDPETEKKAERKTEKK